MPSRNSMAPRARPVKPRPTSARKVRRCICDLRREMATKSHKKSQKRDKISRAPPFVECGSLHTGLACRGAGRWLRVRRFDRHEELLDEEPGRAEIDEQAGFNAGRREVAQQLGYVLVRSGSDGLQFH